MVIAITQQKELVIDRFAEMRNIATQANDDATKALKTLMTNLTNISPTDFLPLFYMPEFEMLSLTRGERPTAPTVNFPDLVVQDVDTETPRFNYTDTPYRSELLEVVTDKLKSGVTEGGYGLGSAGEQALIDRDRIRRERALQDQIDGFDEDWCENHAGDLGIPDGKMLAGKRKLRQEFLAGEQTASKDISVKMLELARQQEEVYLREAGQLENVTSGKHTADQSRLLEAAKVEPEIAIRAVEASLNKARLSIEHYNAIAAKVNAQAVIYKAEMDGYTAEADIGSKELMASTEKHKTLVAAASAESEANWRTDGNVVEQSKAIWGLRAQAMQAIVQMFTNLQAAAMTAVSASANLSTSASNSFSDSESTVESKSESTSNSESHSYNYYPE